MAEKYIDLFDAVKAENGRRDPAYDVGISDALRFLDEHPEQVPGRTITASELRERSHYMTDNERVTFMAGLSAAGGRVVPDPEPTNAEKLAEAITNAAHGVGIGSTTANIKAIAEHLDDAGVKAPGGAE